MMIDSTGSLGVQYYSFGRNMTCQALVLSYSVHFIRSEPTLELSVFQARDSIGVVNCGRGSKNCPQKMSKLFWPFILIGSRTWKGKKSHPSRWISILTPVGQKTVPSKEVPSVFVPTPRFHAKISLVVKLGLGTKQKTAILRGKFSIYFLGCQLC